MTATHGVGTYGNAAGTVTPLDHKMAQLGLFVKTAANTIRAGLLWDGSATIVSGKANMSYDVRAFTAVLSRGSSAGAVILANDGTYNVATTAAPGSNSRYDVVYLWQREYSLDGTDSDPVIGVVQGTAAASPTVPTLAAYPGAIELARILVPSGVTATNSGTTITQTAPFTAAAGGVVMFRSSVERDASVLVDGTLCKIIGASSYSQSNGSAWVALSAEVGLIPVIPTSVAGTGVSVGAAGKVTFTTATSINVNGCFTSGYDNYKIVLNITNKSSVVDTLMRLRLAGTDSSASIYNYVKGGDTGSSRLVATSSSQAQWAVDNGGVAVSDGEITVFAPALATTTRGHVNGSAEPTMFGYSIGLYHTATTAYDGFTVFVASGTITGTIRIYGYNNN